jgi:GTP-binding protein EngB required for normal cell division
MKRILEIKGKFVLFENNTPIKVVSPKELDKIRQENREKLKAKIRRYTLLKLAREIEITALNIVTSTHSADKEYYEKLQRLHFEEILRRSN